MRGLSGNIDQSKTKRPSRVINWRASCGTGGSRANFNISEDTSASQEKVQTFVDAYNSLIDTVDSLTTNGSDGTSAGVFAGDAGLNSLANQLDDIAHASYNGESIVDYGITLDSHGHLQIDADQFNDAMKSDPDGLTA